MAEDKFVTQREFDKSIERIEKAIDTIANNHLKHIADDVSNIKLKLVELKDLPVEVDNIKKNS